MVLYKFARLKQKTAKAQGFAHARFCPAVANNVAPLECGVTAGDVVAQSLDIPFFDLRSPESFYHLIGLILLPPSFL